MEWLASWGICPQSPGSILRTWRISVRRGSKRPESCTVRMKRTQWRWTAGKSAKRSSCILSRINSTGTGWHNGHHPEGKPAFMTWQSPGACQSVIWRCSWISSCRNFPPATEMSWRF